MEHPPKVRAVEGPIAERHPGGIAQDEGEDRFSAGLLDEVEEGRWSWTWHVPEDVRRDAVREIRPWAEERFGPLDRIERYEVETVWRAYDLPARAS